VARRRSRRIGLGAKQSKAKQSARRSNGRRLKIRDGRVLLWALLPRCAPSGRNVDRRQHNEHAEDGVKQDARAVRCPGHDVFLSTCVSVVADISGRAAPVCDLRHTFALLGLHSAMGKGCSPTQAGKERVDARADRDRREVASEVVEFSRQITPFSAHGREAGAS
jgi:hypothetical protein